MADQTVGLVDLAIPGQVFARLVSGIARQSQLTTTRISRELAHRKGHYTKGSNPTSLLCTQARMVLVDKRWWGVALEASRYQDSTWLRANLFICDLGEKLRQERDATRRARETVFVESLRNCDDLHNSALFTVVTGRMGTVQPQIAEALHAYHQGAKVPVQSVWRGDSFLHEPPGSTIGIQPRQYRPEIVLAGLDAIRVLLSNPPPGLFAATPPLSS